MTLFIILFNTKMPIVSWKLKLAAVLFCDVVYNFHIVVQTFIKGHFTKFYSINGRRLKNFPGNRIQFYTYGL